MDLPGEAVAALLPHPIALEPLPTMVQRPLGERGPIVALDASVEPECFRPRWPLSTEMRERRC